MFFCSSNVSSLELFIIPTIVGTVIVASIPNMTISSYTNFRINGETTNRASTIETDPVTITWQTSFTDNSAQPDGTFQNTYYNLKTYIY